MNDFGKQFDGPDSKDFFGASFSETDRWLMEKERHPGRALFSLLASKLLEAIQKTSDVRIPPSGGGDKEERFEVLYKSGEGGTTIYLKPPDLTDLDWETGKPNTGREGAKVEFHTDFRDIIQNWQYKRNGSDYQDVNDSEVFGEIQGWQVLEDELLMEKTIEVVSLTFFDNGGKVTSIKIVAPEMIELQYPGDTTPHVYSFSKESLIDPSSDFLQEEEPRTVDQYSRRVLEIVQKIQSWIPGSVDTVRTAVKE